MAQVAPGLRDTIQGRIDDYVNDVSEFIRVPSTPSDHDAVEAMADLLEATLKRRGYRTLRESVPGGNPSFIAEIGSGVRALLFFNHYDVDPPGDLDAWTTPPFEPATREGCLFGRGTADNKGNLVARLAAVQLAEELYGPLPFRVVFLIEAKQSMYAPHLGEFVDRHRDILATEACVWENSALDGSGRPMLRLGDKGMVMVRVTARGTSRDLSSQYAPIFPSASWALVTFLSRIRDRDGEITLPGFARNIVPLSADERELLDAQALDLKALEALSGASLNFPDKLSALTQYHGSPTSNIALLHAAPKASGMMSANPSEASAELDFRLVPQQEPDQVLESLRDLAAQFDGRIEIESLGTMAPARTAPAADFVRLVAEVAEQTYGKAPVLEPLSPAVGSRSVLNWSGQPVIGFGIAYPGSNIQAPNEHIRLNDLQNGVAFYTELLRAFAAEGEVAGRSS